MKVLVKSLRALSVVLLGCMAVSFVVSLFSIESHNWAPVLATAGLTILWWIVMAVVAELDPLDEY